MIYIEIHQISLDFSLFCTLSESFPFLISQCLCRRYLVGKLKIQKIKFWNRAGAGFFYDLACDFETVSILKV